MPYMQFIAIGLGPPPGNHSRSARLANASYRLAGFALLAAIVIVLVGYIATSAFYMVNRTWVAPTVVAPADERVVALQAELTAWQTQRDRIAGELAEAARAFEAEQRYQVELVAAIEEDLAARRAELARVERLASATAATREHIRATNRAFATRRAAKLARTYRARLVSRTGMMAGKLQLAELSGASLSLAERQAALDTRAAELGAEVAALHALLDDDADGSQFSYDVLSIKRDLDASRLALARAQDTYSMLLASLRRQEHLLANLEQAAPLRALRDGAALAVVPYENLPNVRKGAKLFACRAAMVWCREVGFVLDVLPGEVALEHPFRERQLRGRMIELRLSEREAARNEVLFAGGAPLWL